MIDEAVGVWGDAGEVEGVGTCSLPWWVDRADATADDDDGYTEGVAAGMCQKSDDCVAEPGRVW